MYHTIYQITNLNNGKVYVGKHQTRDLDDGYMGSGKLIRRAIGKHGLESFSKEILHVFGSEQEMNAKEAELVTEQFCKEDNYNLCPGGHGGFGYINSKGLNLQGRPNPQNFQTGADHKRRAIENGTWEERRSHLAALMKNAAALRKPMNGSANHNSKRVKDEHGMVFESLTALAKYVGITKDAAGRRLKRGMYELCSNGREGMRQPAKLI